MHTTARRRPVDWTTRGLPDDPILGNCRLFVRDIKVDKGVNGTATLISPGYVNVTTDFERKR